MSDNSSSSILLSMFGMLFWCAVLIISICMLINPYTSISSDSKAQLQNIFISVEKTPFKKTFYDKYAYYMENGNVSKDEFDKLQSFYANYKVAVASNTAGEFIKEQDSLYKQQQERNKQFDLFWSSYGVYITAFAIFFILVVIKFFFFNWVKGY